MKPKESIYQMLKDLVAKTVVNEPSSVSAKVFGSLLIALSGCILYLDKVFKYLDIEFVIPNKFVEAGIVFQTFIWLWSQTLAPILIISGAMFRPYKLSYLIPLFCYSLQLYLLAFDTRVVDDTYIGLYAFGTFVLILSVILGIKWLLHNLFQRKLASIKQELKEKIKNA
jgi:hypothetical protein